MSILVKFYVNLAEIMIKVLHIKYYLIHLRKTNNQNSL